jgi:hypothetical protein
MRASICPNRASSSVVFFPLWKRGVEGDLARLAHATTVEIPPAPPFSKGGTPRDAAIEVLGKAGIGIVQEAELY